MSSGEVNKKRVFEADGRITEAGLAASNATLVDPPAVAIGLAGQGWSRNDATVNDRVNDALLNAHRPAPELTRKGPAF